MRTSAAHEMHASTPSTGSGQVQAQYDNYGRWIPACAGMTRSAGMTERDGIYLDITTRKESV
ncbi:MAG: hypothetical protein IIA17_02960 [candidate division Zixibacteria bacterium]|nr:hypothetical protein [candidate division Zixibacteria bacterium]